VRKNTCCWPGVSSGRGSLGTSASGGSKNAIGSSDPYSQELLVRRGPAAQSLAAAELRSYSAFAQAPSLTISTITSMAA
jgi:hypothetical protein